ncbi:MAG: phosphoribosylamine--glycine ligase [Bacteroidales bacterium]|nr:phosphoribosylamine--glycine ligase [Bacteroidales bacterium]
MNILILGSGGREHALAWKLSQGETDGKIFVAPGNAGTSEIAVNLDIDPEHFDEVKREVICHNIGMVIVGSEAPLVRGIADYFSSDEEMKDVILIGPSAQGSMLEGSKHFAKEFMKRHGIPTAGYGTFIEGELEEAKEFMKTMKTPYVLKADGLAAGKGVVILDDYADAVTELEGMFGGKFGAAGRKVVIEEFMEGIELSVFVLTDGISYRILPEAKDYKRIGEGDSGLNTGGMGAVSPVPFADREFMDKVERRIIRPTVEGLASENISYRGFIFFGLIKCGDDPYVIEYNVRLGDPEAEVIIPRIRSSLTDLLLSVNDGSLGRMKVETDPRYVTTVMMVSGGYPGTYEKGKVISGIEKVSGSVVFHAGTRKDSDKTVTSGGRVLAVSSWGHTMGEALALSYSGIEKISFEGAGYRRDIGFDL